MLRSKNLQSTYLRLVNCYAMIALKWPKTALNAEYYHIKSSTVGKFIESKPRKRSYRGLALDSLISSKGGLATLSNARQSAALITNSLTYALVSSFSLQSRAPLPNLLKFVSKIIDYSIYYFLQFYLFHAKRRKREKQIINVSLRMIRAQSEWPHSLILHFILLYRSFFLLLFLFPFFLFLISHLS